MQKWPLLFLAHVYTIAGASDSYQCLGGGGGGGDAWLHPLLPVPHLHSLGSADLLLQLKETVQQSLGSRGTSRDIDVYGHYPVTATHNSIGVVVVASPIGTAAEGRGGGIRGRRCGGIRGRRCGGIRGRRCGGIRGRRCGGIRGRRCGGIRGRRCGGIRGRRCGGIRGRRCGGIHTSVPTSPWR